MTAASSVDKEKRSSTNMTMKAHLLLLALVAPATAFAPQALPGRNSFLKSSLPDGADLDAEGKI